MTASEIVKSRADAKKPNMGLTNWKQQKINGKIIKSDVGIAKNYLSEPEISELNNIASMYLEYAELQARRNKVMTMQDWIGKLDAFLQFNEYDLLEGSGKIKADIAKKFAEEEFDKYRIIQDVEFISDFDKVVQGIKTDGKLPVEHYDRQKFTGSFTLSIKEQMEKEKNNIVSEEKKKTSTKRK